MNTYLAKKTGMTMEGWKYLTVTLLGVDRSFVCGLCSSMRLTGGEHFLFYLLELLHSIIFGKATTDMNTDYIKVFWPENKLLEKRTF